MPIGTNSVSYSFDPTRLSSANKITGEQHITMPVNAREYHIVVPNLAPFFLSNLVLTFRDQSNNVVTLVESLDGIFEELNNPDEPEDPENP